MADLLHGSVCCALKRDCDLCVCVGGGAPLPQPVTSQVLGFVCLWQCRWRTSVLGCHYQVYFVFISVIDRGSVKTPKVGNHSSRTVASKTNFTSLTAREYLVYRFADITGTQCV